MWKIEIDPAQSATGEAGFVYCLTDVAGRKVAGFEATADGLSAMIAKAIHEQVHAYQHPRSARSAA